MDTVQDVFLVLSSQGSGKNLVYISIQKTVVITVRQELGCQQSNCFNHI